jgi:hypothetical protein
VRDAIPPPPRGRPWLDPPLLPLARALGLIGAQGS